MLAIATALLVLAWPLKWHGRAQPQPPPKSKQRLARRAPLAEHEWEARVLFNLTKSRF